MVNKNDHYYVVCTLTQIFSRNALFNYDAMIAAMLKLYGAKYIDLFRWKYLMDIWSISKWTLPFENSQTYGKVERMLKQLVFETIAGFESTVCYIIIKTWILRTSKKIEDRPMNGPTLSPIKMTIHFSKQDKYSLK